MRLASININFDSFSEALGFPGNYQDPAFGPVIDRFFSISERYNFKYTIDKNNQITLDYKGKTTEEIKAMLQALTNGK